MAWCLPGHKPLSEPIMVNLLTHIYVTHPQLVKYHIAPRESIAGEEDVWTTFVLFNKVVRHMYIKLAYNWSNSAWSLSLTVLINHYSDAIIGALMSQITSLVIVYSTVYSGSHQRTHQSSSSLAFVRRIHRRPVDFPHKGPIVRKFSIWWRHHDESILYNSPSYVVIQWLFNRCSTTLYHRDTNLNMACYSPEYTHAQPLFISALN